MTDDDHNMMAEDPQDETMGAGEIVHEAPSEYEFADEQTATTGIKKRPLLPIAAAAGGILILAGVAWWQLSGTTAPADNSFKPVAATTTTRAPDSVPPAVPPVSADAAAAVPAAPKNDAAAVMAPPNDAAPTAPNLVSDSSSTALPSAPINGNVNPASGAPTPVNAAPLKPAPINVVAAAPLPPAGAAVPSGSGAAPMMQTLAPRIDALEKDVEQLTAQLGQMNNVLAATAMSKESHQDVEHRLDMLEEKINNLHVSAAMPKKVADIQPAPVMSFKHHQNVKMTAGKTARIKIHKPTQTALTGTSSTIKYLDKPEFSQPKTNWVLRSASPDQGWISDGATSHDLKQVKVGDTLPTIGRVTFIGQDGDHWVVRGTQGSIQ